MTLVIENKGPEAIHPEPAHTLLDYRETSFLSKVGIKPEHKELIQEWIKKRGIKPKYMKRK